MARNGALHRRPLPLGRVARPVLWHWETPTVGVSFVLTVSTESLAVLAAFLALGRGAPWLDVAAQVLLGLGLLAYVFVLARFDLRQVLLGRGDQWVAGGALAIAALACARLTAAVDAGPSAAHARS